MTMQIRMRMRMYKADEIHRSEVCFFPTIK